MSLLEAPVESPRGGMAQSRSVAPHDQRQDGVEESDPQPRVTSVLSLETELYLPLLSIWYLRQALIHFKMRCTDSHCRNN